MSAFIHRFVLTVLAAVLFTAGARAQVDDLNFVTSGIERISVEAWEAAQTRAYDAKRARQIGAITRTLRDGARWAAREARRVAVVAAAEGQRLVGEMRRTVAESVIAADRFAAAAIARADRGSLHDIVLAARDIAAEGRRLIVDARRALADAFPARRRMTAHAEAGTASMAVAMRRFAADIDHTLVAMGAESRRIWAYAALRSIVARDAALTAREAFGGGRAALRLMTAPRPVVKTSLRVEVENAIGAAVAAPFAAASEPALTIRVWKLSRKSMGRAALAGGAAKGLERPLAPAEHDLDDEAMNVRFEEAIDAVQRAGTWLRSVR